MAECHMTKMRPGSVAASTANSITLASGAMLTVCP
jgi:hypothetical protein